MSFFKTVKGFDRFLVNEEDSRNMDKFKQFFNPGRDYAEEKIFEYVKVTGFVRGLIRVHGVPLPLEVVFGTMEQLADQKGGATSTEKGNLIILGTDTFDEVPMSKRMEAFAGVAIHEAEHILSSQDFFRWIEMNKSNLENPDGELGKRIIMMKEILNQVEDARIEIKACDRSPGFASYIATSKRELIENNILKDKTKNWEKMSPRSKANLIAFMATRTPYLITEDMKKFERCGVYPYKVMKGLTDSLESFMDTKRISDKIIEMLMKFEHPEETNQKFQQGKGASGGKGTPQKGKQFTHKELEQMKKESGADQKRMEAEAKKEKEQRQDAETAQKANTSKRNGAMGREEQKARQFKDLQKARSRSSDSGEKKAQDAESMVPSKDMFGFGDMHKASKQDRVDKDSVMLGHSEQVFKGLVDEKFKIKKVITWGDNKPRDIAFIEPKVREHNLNMYAELKANYQKYVRKMQSVFNYRLAEITKKQSGKKYGRLHRKKLGVSQSTDRLFYKTTKTRATGLSICLLLDESGSMGNPSVTGTNEGSRALQMSFVMQEALLGLPRMDVSLYGHTTYGESNNDCIIRRYYAKGRKDRKAITAYGRNRANNYDGFALEAVGEEFLKASEYKNRLIIMLSDGKPNGRQYGGEPAYAHIRGVVKNLKKQGVNVLNIGIASAEPELMFENYIHFTEINKMVPEMEKVLRKIILGSGRERVI